jgi:hypothetical protein
MTRANAALSHPEPSERAPVTSACTKYRRVGRARITSPAAPSVRALSSQREALMRRIAARRKSHQGYRDLEVRLVNLTTDQLRAEMKIRRRNKE